MKDSGRLLNMGEEYRMNLLDDFLATQSCRYCIRQCRNRSGARHVLSLWWRVSCHTWRSELSVPYSCIRKISELDPKWQNKETK